MLRHRINYVRSRHSNPNSGSSSSRSSSSSSSSSNSNSNSIYVLVLGGVDTVVQVAVTRFKKCKGLKLRMKIHKSSAKVCYN